MDEGDIDTSEILRGLEKDFLDSRLNMLAF